MIKELSELGKKLRNQKTKNEWVDDALKEEIISLVLTIKPDGSFVSLQSIEKKKTTTEAIQRTSGKEGRLLIDNCGYMLGVYDSDSDAFKKKIGEKGEKQAHDIFKKDVSEKLTLFLKRLNELADLNELRPVLKFYNDNKQKGIDIVSQEYFLKNISKKERSGNIALLILGENKYVHEYDSVYHRIIDSYESRQREFVTSVKRKCAICAEEQFPVGDFTHFPIKGVPGDKEPAGGRKLISYNVDSFESYEMVGNENCMMCTNCAKTYVEGLNWLLSNGNPIKVTDKKGKEKDGFKYTNRKNFGSDTAMVFWTRENVNIKEIDLLEAPDPQEVANLIDSVVAGDTTHDIETNKFYACTLSGAAARIAVRDWTESSLVDFRKSIAQWFKDIAINYFDYDSKKNQIHYSRLYMLAGSCQNEKEDKKVILSRTATYLWNAALKNTSPPLWMLTAVLKRARLDKNGITPDRAALIKLILNRDKKGGEQIMENLDKKNNNTAYVSGRLFAVLESIQWYALGDTNVGIKDRFFSSASTTPATAFGRLLKMSQHHFSKLKGEKPGLAVNFDKQIQELMAKISCFPVMFSLEEQGNFAIGYYHQKNTMKNKKEE